MIYVASKTKHADMWKEYRRQGVPIISSWIDEAGVGETKSFAELWTRIENEVYKCRALVLYVEPDDFPLKGALIEVGMALAFKRPVFISCENVVIDGYTSRPIGSWLQHPDVKLLGAIDRIRLVQHTGI